MVLPNNLNLKLKSYENGVTIKENEKKWHWDKILMNKFLKNSCKLEKYQLNWIFFSQIIIFLLAQ